MQKNINNQALNKENRDQRIVCRCSIEEKTQIKANAQRCNLSISRYVCNLALGYKPQSLEKIKERARLHNQVADLGRLGGLLKLLLTDKTKSYAVGIKQIQIVLHKIKQNQARLKQMALRV